MALILLGLIGYCLIGALVFGINTGLNDGKEDGSIIFIWPIYIILLTFFAIGELLSNIGKIIGKKLSKMGVPK